MSDERRPATPHDASVESAEAAALAAYRSEEPVRQRDPFHGAALQQLIAEEAGARATRQHGGPLAWLTRWLRSAPRPALAGAALSLALLATGVPLASLQPTVESAVGSDPAAVMSELPGAEPLDTRSANDGAAAESVGVVTETETLLLLITGAVGLAVSLLAAESARRRRRT
ncbi:MAG: hypothetical protein ACO3BX_05920 [Candidatus Limnocylindrus sp.]